MVTRSIVVPGPLMRWQEQHSSPAWKWQTTQLAGSSATKVSFSHRAPFGRANGDNGGPFQVTKYENIWGIKNRGGTTGPYHGDFTCGAPVNPGSYVDYKIGNILTDSEMDQKGTTAIARCEPTNPAFDAATALGELLSDGSPQAFGGSFIISTMEKRTKLAKQAGGEYLNAEFGWVPLVSDLNKLARAVHESHKIMKSYRKGSDSKVRRSYSYPEDFRVQAFQGSMLPIPSAYPSFLTGSEVSSTENSLWFSGAFKYHLPTSDSQMNKFEDFKQKASKLYGVRLTPETVWNLAPWSWAADWFANTGDVIHNISALGTDGLVMQYGYMMSSKKTRRVRQGTNSGYSVSHELRETRLQRRPATPYGFGANLQALSGSQIAVLAALGLSRR